VIISTLLLSFFKNGLTNVGGGVGGVGDRLMYMYQLIT
jgi:hypothetical protein